MPRDHPNLPVDKLHAAVSDDSEARKRIDALHRELASEKPEATAIKEHVEELRKHAPIAAIIANWFEDPRTQLFINELVQAGL